MAHAKPLPTLLSQALVAFTIDFDNEFGRRMPHRTTRFGGTRGAPWLVSMAMWFNCMRFVDREGIRIGDLENLARTPTNLRGMERWGYVEVDRETGMIRATAAGLRAREIGGPLGWEIEGRFGPVEEMRAALETLVAQFDFDLPDCMPILGDGLWSQVAAYPRRETSRLPLPALLSRALLAFAVEFERESEVSLAICANVLRVVDERGVRMKDLPRLGGVSKEAVSVAVGWVARAGFAAVEARVAQLTQRGLAARDEYRRTLASLEERWRARFGAEAIDRLRASLDPRPGKGIDELYGSGWRAATRKPETLPHYPMVLHRGGFPDGS
jgi:ribosomal protein L28